MFGLLELRVIRSSQDRVEAGTVGQVQKSMPSL
jgi:hypothetical protein